MAISKTYINDDFSVLQSFLSASGLFGSVEVNERTVTCKDSESNTLLTFSVASSAMTITAYANSSVSKEIQYPYGSSSTQVIITYGYACTNGVMLQFSGMNYAACVLITKTNSGGVAIVMSDSTISNRKPYTDAVWCVAWGDVSPFASFTFTTNERNQTVISPFVTCAGINNASYTDKAGFIPIGQYYSSGYGTLSIDGTAWLTNGYWAIEDGEIL